MSTSRYDSKQILTNREELYEEALLERGIKYFRQYGTAVLSHPVPAQIRRLDRVGHVWSIGDRYYKLAHQYYGDSRYWWVIAWYNQKPTEAHLKLGDTISIPLPLYKILSILKVG